MAARTFFGPRQFRALLSEQGKARFCWRDVFHVFTVGCSLLRKATAA